MGRAGRVAVASGLAALGLSTVPAQLALASAPYPPMFSSPQVQPQADPGFSVAIGFYGHQLFSLAWNGRQTDKIFYSAYGSNCKGFSLLPCWTPQASVGEALSGSAPALVGYGGEMYAFWTGRVGVGAKVWYSAYDGTSWSAQQWLDVGLRAYGQAPAATVYNGDLYVAWITRFSFAYSAFNGSSWSQSAPVVPVYLVAGNPNPTLASYGGDLYLFWSFAGWVWYTSYNGSAWSKPTTLAGTWGNASSASAVAVAVCDGDLFAAWRTSPPGIQYSDFDGSTWTEPTLVPGTAGAVNAPALGASGDTLYLAWAQHLPSGPHRIYFTSAQNVGSPPPPPPK